MRLGDDSRRARRLRAVRRPSARRQEPTDVDSQASLGERDYAAVPGSLVDDETIAANADTSGSLASQLKLIRSTVSLVGLTLELLLVGVGVLLLVRARRPRRRGSASPGTESRHDAGAPSQDCLTQDGGGTPVVG